MVRSRIPWLLPEQNTSNDPSEFRPAFDHELAGTQNVTKEVVGVAVNAVGLVKNTLLFVGKIPCLAVAPSYSEGISDNGKGIFKSAGEVIGCTLKTVGKSSVNAYDWYNGYTLLKTSRLHYASEEIKTYFANGVSIYELTDMLRDGSSTTRCVGPIRCVWYKDRWYSLDSQKLWCIKTSGIKQCCIQELSLESCKKEWGEIFTTRTKGRQITVKGDRPPKNPKPMSTSMKVRNTLKCSTLFPDKRKKKKPRAQIRDNGTRLFCCFPARPESTED